MNILASLHHDVCRSWQEPNLQAKHLIYPLFITSKSESSIIEGFVSNKRWGSGVNRDYKELVVHLSKLVEKGLKAVMLYGVVTLDEKDSVGTFANCQESPVIICGKILKKEFPNLLLCYDVCLCEYTDHGHCGLLRSFENEKEPLINTSESVKRLCEIALSYAQAGAHMLCPSDMMDGRIKIIREILNSNGFSHVALMSYTSKKASTLYGPFRTAVESTFMGNRKRYQHPIGSSLTALKALKRDLAEGADFVIIKPSLFYGDLIKTFSTASTVPVVAFVVSGEYKMIYDYGHGTHTFEEILRESHTSLLRAGASVIITYFTPELLEYIPRWN
ncbi:hypothetical protein Zmor_004341 [Zophobas morio]|uniref:Delta-aminolevulinic acid dehydratase n=1 Tax=Zophobas morio TaxID=2755281 RepID=A0AA38HIE6_9CUCU|nr:hypothetical protein Zmor_004341 [Zophobas morio]